MFPCPPLRPSLFRYASLTHPPRLAVLHFPLPDGQFFPLPGCQFHPVPLPTPNKPAPGPLSRSRSGSRNSRIGRIKRPNPAACGWSGCRP
ncbi:hypothetical protein BCR34DRAFT_566269 [Clohesyomyces aquaticus]|uniref:Uncharacterized protein n=1 Tax=Clohesyomyces aquaticus TaxID=1231657 RepID=A0A1Y1ZKD2_9PLEO|nr:hypothetical protein BCR34DRAFT_566269 [Clohesyomyces aquaticus]